MVATTSRSKSSTAVVDKSLAERALQALLKHHQSTSDPSRALLGTDTSIQVQFTLEKIPENPSPKPIRILIPHALHKLSQDHDADDEQGVEEPSVCLIVKEESKPWVQEMISNFPKEMGFVQKVLGLDSLRKKHARYEQRRLLLQKYDVFMADDRILPMLCKSLGKDFFKAKKQPIPINITRKQALPFNILQTLQATFLYISSGTTLSVRAATTGMMPSQVLENAMAVIENAVPKIPGKWTNVRAIAVKTPTSMSLPIYNKTPLELQEIAQMAGLHSNNQMTTHVQIEEEKAQKEAKRKLAKEESPLLQALKMQKLLEKEGEKNVNEMTNKKKKSKVESEAADETMEDASAKKKTRKEHKLSPDSGESKSSKKTMAPADTVKANEEATKSKVESPADEAVSSSKKKRKKEGESKSSKVGKASSDKKEEQGRGDFIASEKFKGSRKGYVFRNGTNGVGYYVDVKPVVDRMAMEAFQRLGRVTGGGGRKVSKQKGKKRNRR